MIILSKLSRIAFRIVHNQLSQSASSTKPQTKKLFTPKAKQPVATQPIAEKQVFGEKQVFRTSLASLKVNSNANLNKGNANSNSDDKNSSMGESASSESLLSKTLRQVSSLPQLCEYYKLIQSRRSEEYIVFLSCLERLIITREDFQANKALLRQIYYDKQRISCELMYRPGQILIILQFLVKCRQFDKRVIYDSHEKLLVLLAAALIQKKEFTPREAILAFYWIKLLKENCTQLKIQIFKLLHQSTVASKGEQNKDKAMDNTPLDLQQIMMLLTEDHEDSVLSSLDYAIYAKVLIILSAHFEQHMLNASNLMKLELLTLIIKINTDLIIYSNHMLCRTICNLLLASILKSLNPLWVSELMEGKEIVNKLKEIGVVGIVSLLECIDFYRKFKSARLSQSLTHKTCEHLFNGLQHYLTAHPEMNPNAHLGWLIRFISARGIFRIWISKKDKLQIIVNLLEKCSFQTQQALFPLIDRINQEMGNASPLMDKLLLCLSHIAKDILSASTRVPWALAFVLLNHRNHKQSLYRLIKAKIQQNRSNTNILFQESITFYAYLNQLIQPGTNNSQQAEYLLEKGYLTEYLKQEIHESSRNKLELKSQSQKYQVLNSGVVSLIYRRAVKESRNSKIHGLTCLQFVEIMRAQEELIPNPSRLNFSQRDMLYICMLAAQFKPDRADEYLPSSASFLQMNNSTIFAAISQTECYTVPMIAYNHNLSPLKYHGCCILPKFKVYFAAFQKSKHTLMIWNTVTNALQTYPMQERKKITPQMMHYAQAVFISKEKESFGSDFSLKFITAVSRSLLVAEDEQQMEAFIERLLHINFSKDTSVNLIIAQNMLIHLIIANKLTHKVLQEFLQWISMRGIDYKSSRYCMRLLRASLQSISEPFPLKPIQSLSLHMAKLGKSLENLQAAETELIGEADGQLRKKAMEMNYLQLGIHLQYHPSHYKSKWFEIFSLLSSTEEVDEYLFMANCFNPALITLQSSIDCSMFWGEFKQIMSDKLSHFNSRGEVNPNIHRHLLSKFK